MTTITATQYAELVRLASRANRLHAELDKVLALSLAVTGETEEAGHTDDFVFAQVGEPEAKVARLLEGLGITVVRSKRGRPRKSRPPAEAPAGG